jgi:predicted ArsR family transcriptional regulator
MTMVGQTKTRIVEMLRAKPCCAGLIAKTLGISKVAVHKHLEDLEHTGLVRARLEKAPGRGRPKQIYQAIDEQTPYATMCSEVLTHMRELLGSDTVLQVFSYRNQTLLRQLQPLMQGLNLEQKLCALVGFLNEQGYQAQFYSEDGQWYLQQDRCPKLALAMQHSEVCSSELELYQALLGVSVLRESRLAAAGDCCRYCIGPKN